LAPVVLVAGVGGGLAWLLHALSYGGGETLSWVAPGGVTAQVADPGLYVLWHDARAVYENRAFDHPKELPEGMKVSVVDQDSGEEVGGKPVPGLPERSGEQVRYALAKYRIPKPGPYRIVASGGAGERLLSFGSSGRDALVYAALGCAVFNLIGWGGSFAIAVIVLSRRTKMRHLLPREEEAG
jgi:hypothetical protein